MTEKPTHHCHFCAKSQHAVLALIAGPVGVAGQPVCICDECVDLCVEICADYRRRSRADSHLRDIRENGT